MCETCESSGGLGYIATIDEAGHPYVQICRCLKDKLAKSKAGLPDKYLDCTWDNWESVKQLTENIEFLKNWGGDPPLVVLFAKGKSNLGTGKTRVLATLVREWRLAGKMSRYTTMSDILFVEKARMDDVNVSGMGIMDCQEYDGLFAIDDVGAEHDTDWSRSMFEALIDFRYRNAKPTIVATNLGEAEMRERYPRSWSRFYEGKWLEWIAPDFRRKA